jgi:signal transduction histidine kinase
VPLAEAVADAASMIEPQMAAKGHHLEVRLPEPDPGAAGGAGPAAWADRERLRQVLLNLLGNAAKFTPPRGHVTLEASADGPDRVRVCVCDSGAGIPPDRLARIFEPFVQAHSGLTRPAEGTGLGLAISRDLARGMGGDLTAGDAPAGGAAFTLTLRRAPAPPGA